MSEEKSPFAERKLDAESLKGLSHPLRVQLFDALSVYGPATASALADRLGESSGATSYHLRQLERHGFVREVEGKGTGRERWWERVPGGVTISATEIDDSPSTRAATQAVMRQWEQNRSVLLNDFIARGVDALPDEWMDVSNVATANLRLTSEQLKHVTESWEAWAREILEPLRGQSQPGSRPVQIHFNAFPVLGGEEQS
jgi:DNA-binding transcriptional ArsR family regulator